MGGLSHDFCESGISHTSLLLPRPTQMLTIEFTGAIASNILDMVLLSLYRRRDWLGVSSC